MKRVMIACSMVEDEIYAVQEAHRDDHTLDDLEIIWMERGHHNVPERLHRVIQEEIDRAEAAGAEQILLCYGLCGNGALGWHTEAATLAMPRFDDCINMMLCPAVREKRSYMEAGKMYLTRGWSQDEGAVLGMIQRYKERYGERKGLRVARMMWESYRNITVIDTGCYDLGPVQRYAREAAEILRLEPEVVAGGNHPIEKLMTGKWDADILVKEAHQTVEMKDFEFSK